MNKSKNIDMSKDSGNDDENNTKINDAIDKKHYVKNINNLSSNFFMEDHELDMIAFSLSLKENSNKKSITTHDPQITFLKLITRTHTEFIKNTKTYEGKVDLNAKKIIFKIPFTEDDTLVDEIIIVNEENILDVKKITKLTMKLTKKFPVYAESGALTSFPQEICLGEYNGLFLSELNNIECTFGNVNFASNSASIYAGTVSNSASSFRKSKKIFKLPMISSYLYGSVLGTSKYYLEIEIEWSEYIDTKICISYLSSLSDGERERFLSNTQQSLFQIFKTSEHVIKKGHNEIIFNEGMTDCGMIMFNFDGGKMNNINGVLQSSFKHVPKISINNFASRVVYENYIALTDNTYLFDVGKNIYSLINKLSQPGGSINAKDMKFTFESPENSKLHITTVNFDYIKYIHFDNKKFGVILSSMMTDETKKNIENNIANLKTKQTNIQEEIDNEYGNIDVNSDNIDKIENDDEYLTDQYVFDQITISI